MSQASQSPLDQYRSLIEDYVYEGLTNAQIVARLAKLFQLDTSEGSIRRAKRRWGSAQRGRQAQPDPPGVKIEGDEAEVTSDPRAWSVPLNDTDALLRERGLDPDDWEIKSLIVNEWDSVVGDGITLKQMKLHLVRKKPINLILPARLPADYIRPEHWKKLSLRGRDEARLAVLVGDQQAPFHDVRLNGFFLQWLAHNRPDEGVLIGDTMDLTNVSRHPDNPEWAATTQECVDAAYLLIREYVRACEATKWTKLAGNHDERLRRMVIDHIRDIYGLRRAKVPGKIADSPLLDIPNLLRLDELGIEYVAPNGGYKHAQVKLSPYLAARHGWLSRKGSGSSALASLSHLGYSLAVGHTHRLSEVFHTVHDIDGKPTILTAVETGCMCRIEDGLGYTPLPDWQNGFATATIWPDGTFSIDLAKYVDGKLLYRDQSYS